MGLFKINVNLPQLLYFVAFGVSWELSLITGSNISLAGCGIREILRAG